MSVSCLRMMSHWIWGAHLTNHKELLPSYLIQTTFWFITNILTHKSVNTWQWVNIVIHSKMWNDKQNKSFVIALYCAYILFYDTTSPRSLTQTCRICWKGAVQHTNHPFIFLGSYNREIRSMGWHGETYYVLYFCHCGKKSMILAYMFRMKSSLLIPFIIW